MSEANKLLSRRVLVATLVGGGAIAVATARSTLGTAPSAEGFATAFRSPFSNPTLGDHNSWRSELNSQVQVRGGPALRVAKVESFAPFGRAKTGSTRQRAFIVSFDVVGGTPLVGDMIYTITHPSRGSFQLFLTVPRGSPTIAQAIFS